MENKLLDEVTRSFSLELPIRETLDDYLSLILPAIRQWGEDLRETEHYSTKGGKAWMEIRDSESFHEAVLHFFNEGGEYLISVDGNVSRGRWRLLDDSNKMIIEQGNRSELYELAFLSSAFFILRKHGRPGRNQYLVMGFEPIVSNLEWRDYVELLFNTYRSQQNTYKTVAIFLLILITIIILFSIF
ncbi:MAG: hypothetical protein D6714_08815 [Bacteroidetes bacterium]|nr:MAG: hypothetical protein D6714_08815 [Bacteroidota bacterium]